jgi:hypothetical protein
VCPHISLQVKLEELLEDLSLNDEEDDEGAAFFTG